MFYTLITDIVLLCFVLSLVFLWRGGAGWYRHFTWFLLLSFLVEGSGYVCYFVYHHSNHRIFNFFMPVDFFFIGWVMYKVFQPLNRGRQLIWFVLALFSGVYMVENVRSGFAEYSVLSNIVFSICMVILCLLYYYYLIRQDDYIHVFTYPDFWIVTGLFMFYFIETASNFFFTYTAILNKETLYPIRYIIHIVLNFILYGCWGYAFLCKYKKRISSSS